MSECLFREVMAIQVDIIHFSYLYLHLFLSLVFPYLPTCLSSPICLPSSTGSFTSIHVVGYGFWKSWSSIKWRFSFGHYPGTFRSLDTYMALDLGKWQLDILHSQVGLTFQRTASALGLRLPCPTLLLSLRPEALTWPPIFHAFICGKNFWRRKVATCLIPPSCVLSPVPVRVLFTLGSRAVTWTTSCEGLVAMLLTSRLTCCLNVSLTFSSQQFPY